MTGESPIDAVVSPPPLLRAASTINLVAGSVLALAGVVQVALGISAGDHLSVSQGAVTLRPDDAPVWMARIAVILCFGAGAFACWRARRFARSGREQDFARALLLGMAGGLLAALPAWGSLLGVAFTDELDAPVGVWALRLIFVEPFLAVPSSPGAADTWASIQLSPGVNPLHILYLWPLGVTLVNATARALTPSLSGALVPQDRRRELIWILIVAVAGTLLPFVPTGTRGNSTDDIARRYVRAVLSGGDPMSMPYAWPDCPAELRAKSPTDLSRLTPPPASPVARVRVKQRILMGPGGSAALQKYQFAHTEPDVANGTVWVLVELEITLRDGSSRTAKLALSKHSGEWRVAPPKR